MPPLKLTDAELDAVFNAARPLAPNVREDFLKEVADRLSSYAVVGPGTVHRVCLETQRRFFDPPDLGGPECGQSIGEPRSNGGATSPPASDVRTV